MLMTTGEYERILDGKSPLKMAMARAMYAYIQEHGQRTFDNAIDARILQFWKESLDSSLHLIPPKDAINRRWFSMSSATKCSAMHWFHILGFPKDEKLLADAFAEWQIFRTGTDMHNRWQATLEVLGIMKLREHEACVVNQDLFLAAKSDGIVEVESVGRFVVDFKSAARAPTAHSGADPKHVTQCNAYAVLLGEDNFDLLYEEKGNHSVTEFFAATDRAAYDELLQSKIIPVRDAVLALKCPPKEGRDKDGKAGKDCKWCNFNKVCFDATAYKEAFAEVQKRLDGREKPKPVIKRKLKFRRRTGD